MRFAMSSSLSSGRERSKCGTRARRADTSPHSSVDSALYKKMLYIHYPTVGNQKCRTQARKKHTKNTTKLFTYIVNFEHTSKKLTHGETGNNVASAREQVPHEIPPETERAQREPPRRAFNDRRALRPKPRNRNNNSDQRTHDSPRRRQTASLARCVRNQRSR